MRTLYDANTLAGRVAELGAELTTRFGDEPVVALIVLRGAMFFATDLLRAMPDVDVRVSTLRVSSYAGTESTGIIHVVDDVRDELAGRHILLIEDIIDSGRTIAFLRGHLQERRVGSVTVACLFDKPSRREVEAHADLVGFTIEDRFIIGYGLDYDERFRHLPYVAEVEDHDLASWKATSDEA